MDGKGEKKQIVEGVSQTKNAKKLTCVPSYEERKQG
jgi:hypothetical protein